MDGHYVNDREFHERVIEEVLEAYPEKAFKNRRKHLSVAEDGIRDCGVKSNVKSLPGVMTIRGCAFAGSKGVVWGPVKDMVHISHGPVGCGHYSWAQRRNYATGLTGVNSFVTLQFTSDFQERDIVFGGDKKLRTIIDEIETLFPLARGVSIQSECPVGLIGDDIEAVAREKSAQIDNPVVPVRCEGFRGVSQSLGHHIANDTIRDWVLDKGEGETTFEASPYDVVIIGDYNIGGDAWSSRKLLEEMGLRVIAQWTGDSDSRGVATGAEVEAQPDPLLSVDELHRPPPRGEVRNALDGVQLLWTRADRDVAAGDRRALRRSDQGGSGEGRRQVSADCRCRAREVPAAPRRQEGDAVRWRPASSSHRSTRTKTSAWRSSAPATSSRHKDDYQRTMSM